MRPHFPPVLSPHQAPAPLGAHPQPRLMYWRTSRKLQTRASSRLMLSPLIQVSSRRSTNPLIGFGKCIAWQVFDCSNWQPLRVPWAGQVGQGGWASCAMQGSPHPTPSSGMEEATLHFLLMDQGIARVCMQAGRLQSSRGRQASSHFWPLVVVVCWAFASTVLRWGNRAAFTPLPFKRGGRGAGHGV